VSAPGFEAGTTIRELRRLGGLLKKIHVDSGGAYSRETAAAPTDLRAAILRLAGGDEGASRTRDSGRCWSGRRRAPGGRSTTVLGTIADRRRGSSQRRTMSEMHTSNDTSVCAGRT
jgi:hypothetical protein